MLAPYWNRTLHKLAGKVQSRESTLGARPLPRKQFETPAPGEYNIDRLDKSKLQSGGCVRGYTFGHPNSNHRSNRLPGNNKNKSHTKKRDLFREMKSCSFN